MNPSWKSKEIMNNVDDKFFRRDIMPSKKWLVAKHDFDNDIISAAWSIAKRYGSYQPHLKALYKLSSEIFDAMKKYHGMGKRERVLIQCIAILHDCGKYISLSEAYR